MPWRTEFKWNVIRGATDDEKIDVLVELLHSRCRCDFFVVAHTTLQLPPFVYINRFIPESYRRILLSGRWRIITGSLQIGPTERIIS